MLALSSGYGHHAFGSSHDSLYMQLLAWQWPSLPHFNQRPINNVHLLPIISTGATESKGPLCNLESGGGVGSMRHQFCRECHDFARPCFVCSGMMSMVSLLLWFILVSYNL